MRKIRNYEFGVLHIPHASKHFPNEYIKYFNLSKKDLNLKKLISNLSYFYIYKKLFSVIF